MPELTEIPGNPQIGRKTLHPNRRSGEMLPRPAEQGLQFLRQDDLCVDGGYGVL